MEATGVSLNIGLNASLAGIKQGIKQVNDAAALIAQGSLNPENFVDLIIGENVFKANAAVLRSQDELIGTFLDTFA